MVRGIGMLEFRDIVQQDSGTFSGRWLWHKGILVRQWLIHFVQVSERLCDWFWVAGRMLGRKSACNPWRSGREWEKRKIKGGREKWTNHEINALCKNVLVEPSSWNFGPNFWSAWALFSLEEFSRGHSSSRFMTAHRLWRDKWFYRLTLGLMGLDKLHHVLATSSEDLKVKRNAQKGARIPSCWIHIFNEGNQFSSSCRKAGTGSL